MNINDITITSLETITAFDVVTGQYLFTLDELQNATIEQSQEKTDITGKQGRKLNTLKRNKAVTISGNNGMVSHGLLEKQTGSNFESKVTKVMWTDYMTVLSGKATTAYTAVGTEGAEIIGLYIKNSDGTLGSELEQDSSATSGKFTYAPETKELSFYSDIEDNTEIIAYYERNIDASVLTNMSDTYSGKAELYVDALGEDKCANIYRVQIHFPKADFDGEWSFEMGDNQTIHQFSADALSGACGTRGEFFSYTVFGEKAEDSDSKVLSSITVSTNPTKTDYNVGETFSPAGMVVTASYTDGTTAALNAGSYTYTPNGALTANDTVITIHYSEGGIMKTTTCAITVSAG